MFNIMAEFNNLKCLRHSEQLMVERTVRELEQKKKELGGTGRAGGTLLVDYYIGACLQYAIHAPHSSPPHCAPLRYADVGLLGYRASGMRSPFSTFLSINKCTVILQLYLNSDDNEKKLPR